MSSASEARGTFRAAWGLALALAWPAAAQADVTVAAPSCEGIDFDALRGLIEVEIGTVATEWREVSTPVVLLGCTGAQVRIEITDPVTDKSVARTIAMPELGRERVLAIAVAQLFLTSWLELLLDDDDAGPGAEEAERRARAALEAALEADEGAPQEEESAAEPEAHPGPVAVVPEPEPDGVPAPGVPAPEVPAPEVPAPEVEALTIEGELALEGGARVRTEGEQLVTGRGGLRGMLVLDGALLIGLRAGFEWGRAFRERGTVHLYQGGLGLIVGWRSPELGRFSVDVTGLAAVEWLALEGHPSTEAVSGGTTLAIVGEAALELAPALRVGPVRVALPLAISVIGFAPEGEVSGEAPVVAGGPVLSAMLRVSVLASL